MRTSGSAGAARRYFGMRRRRSSGRRRERSKRRGEHLFDLPAGDLVDPPRERVIGVGEPA